MVELSLEVFIASFLSFTTLYRILAVERGFVSCDRGVESECLIDPGLRREGKGRERGLCSKCHNPSTGRGG